MSVFPAVTVLFPSQLDRVLGENLFPWKKIARLTRKTGNALVGTRQAGRQAMTHKGDGGHHSYVGPPSLYHDGVT